MAKPHNKPKTLFIAAVALSAIACGYCIFTGLVQTADNIATSDQILKIVHQNQRTINIVSELADMISSGLNRLFPVQSGEGGVSMNGKEIFSNTPYLTAENAEQTISAIEYNDSVESQMLYNRLQKCVELFKVRYTGIVTGFWLIASPADDGGVQVITRIISNLPVEERLELSAAISDLVRDEIAYRITDEDISDLNSIPISDWIMENKIYTIYDIYRG